MTGRDTREFIGLMLVDYSTRWDDAESITFQVPRVEERVLARVS
jgi:hypothetical protein